MNVAVRSDGDPLALIPAFRGVIQGMDTDLPVSEVRSMGAVVGAGIALFLAAAALASLTPGVRTAGVPPALALKGD